MESVGQFLKQEREKKGLSLEEVHRRTRISLRVLQALEEGDPGGVLPAQVILRGFVKNYAAAIGLAPEEATSRLTQGQAPEAASKPLPTVQSVPEKKRPSLGLITTIAVVVLLAGLLLFRSRSTEPPPVVPSPTPAAIPAPEPAPPPVEATPPATGDATTEPLPGVPEVAVPPNGEPATQGLPATGVNAPTPPLGQALPAPGLRPHMMPPATGLRPVSQTPTTTTTQALRPQTTTPPQTATTRPQTTTAPALKPAATRPTTPATPSAKPNSVTAPKPGATNSPATAPATKPVTQGQGSVQPKATKPAATAPSPKRQVLGVRATQQTWLKLRRDGGTVREYLLRPGEFVSWEADERFDLTVGNAAGVEVTLNGQPTGRLGQPGQVVSLTLAKVPPSAETSPATSKPAPGPSAKPALKTTSASALPTQAR